jgi:hypothetical protein
MTTTTNPGKARPAPRRRRSRTVRRLAIVLAVLVGLLVVADFVAAAIFEHQVSKRARAHFGLTDDPAVKVNGFSFLAQAISGEYDHVTVDAKGVPVKDILRDVEVHADLMNVKAPLGDLLSGAAKVTVSEVDGQVRVKAADLTRAISENENEVLRTITRLRIEPVSDKAVLSEQEEGAEPKDQAPEPEDTTAGAMVCGTADLIGQSTDFCVFGFVSLFEQTLKFDPKRLDIRNGLISGQLAPSVQAQVLERFRVTLNPGQLPFKVTPTAVKVEPGALVMKGKAHNVTLSGGGG